MLTTNVELFVPIISVIVPIFNREKYLSRCIGSVLEQSFSAFELILIDDGSTDASGDICRRYAQADSRVRYFYQQNAGVSAARNKGLELACGEYISFVDSDDFLEPNALEILYKAISARQYDLVCASYQQVYADESILPQKLLDSVIESPAELAEICYEMNFHIILGGVWGKLYRSEIIKRHKIKFPIDMSYAEDNIFNIQYYKTIVKAVFLSDIIYNYRENVSSLTARITQKELRNILLILESRGEYYGTLAGSFDVVDFSNQATGFIAQNLCVFSRNIENTKDEKINTIKEILADSRVENYLRRSRLRNNLGIKRQLLLLAMKTRSPRIILMVFSFINLLASNARIKRFYRTIYEVRRKITC